MTVCLAELIHLASHVVHDAKSKLLSFRRFAMMLAYERDECLGKTDEADTESSVVDYSLDCVIVLKLVAVEPERAHQERELLLERSLLEVESLVELFRRDLESPVKLVEELVDPVISVLYVHALDGELHDVDRGEREVASSDRCLWSESVLEYSCAASHCSYLPLVSLRILRVPELMLVERSVEVDEVREEAACRNLACKFVKVVVAVLRQVAYAALLLPDLDREDGGRTVAHAFICSVEDFADHAATLCRCVCTVVD